MSDRFELCGNGAVSAAGYSVNDGAVLSKETTPARHAGESENFDIPSDLAIGTYYYPDVAGFSNFGFDQSISMSFKCTTNADTTLRFRIEATDLPTDDFHNVTDTWTTSENNAVSEIIINPSSAGYTIGIKIIDPAYDRYRLAQVVETTGTVGYAVAASMARKAK